MLLLPEDQHWNNDPWFPEHHLADEEGLLMVGGDLTTDWLLLAYNSGIFPWYNEGQPILWWTPDPRMVVKPSDVHVSKSMRKVLRDNHFTVTYNQNFLEVILACKRIKRNGQDGTWITNDIIDAYLRLHELGHAISVEVWHDEKLVGGLYGIDLKEKGIFCGESMFATMSNASKVGFITLSRKLEKENYHLIDCQMYTDHLASLGAVEIPRDLFLEYLQ
ncbi:leucyl/phenylalanyl-tRNA--protein transferase [Dokdonia sp. Dokd-P16]|uniref:leucyl/phenylalanyl-tRNA--protein transferase n=1 Tax=Dokdonia sp. Dokd-P16 TaxID=2173169 RepID=UPI000D5485D5|nr:leucyl/phenylalanyl-tRNA--protein transferase [Dokdonia sp. Dokd-P16]AWH75653.1 leucyl/phenylalanyl-tRNA--protein transferase [Dokdonia sp. Dokd-P16]